MRNFQDDGAARIALTAARCGGENLRVDETSPARSLSLKPGLIDLLVLFVVFTPVVLGFDRFADDPGVGWHLSTGEWVLEHSAVPQTDPFLAGETAHAWVSDQWASDVLLFALYDAGSWPALYGALTLLFLLIFFGVVYRTAGRASGSWLAAAFATMCCLKLATIHFILRPVMFGFFFFAVVFAVCAHIAARAADDVTYFESGLLRGLLVLPPIFLLWANFHPTFVLGLVLVAILAIAFALEPFFFPAAHEHREVYFRGAANVIGAFVLCVVATLANPYGIGLHESIFALAESDFFARFNDEWHSPDFLEGSGQLAVFCFLVIVSAAYVARERAARMRLFEFGALLALTIAYLRSVRLLPFLSIVLVVPLAHAVRDLARIHLFEWYDGLKRAHELGVKAERWEASSSRGLLGLAIATVVLAVTWATSDEQLGPSERYPHQAIEHLRQLPDDVVLYASPNLGGFITWAGADKVRPIIDDRNTMLGETPYREQLAVVTLRHDDWAERVRATGATHIIVAAGSTFDYAARRDLPVVYSDDRFTVYSVSQE